MAPSSSKATTRAPAKSTGAPANGTGTTKKGTGKTAPAKQNNTAAEATEATTTIADDRFRFIQRDPRFIRLRKRDAKVTLDQRFSHMIDNDDFDFVQKVDKYGRPMSVGAAPRTDLKKFYKLDEKEGEEKERSEADNVVNDSDTSEENVASGSEEDDASVSDASDNDVSVDSDAIASSSEQEEYDPARGEGVPDSSSDEDDVDAVNDDTIETIRLPGAPATVDEDLYREIREPQVPTGEESRRFAVVNMDWDNMSALDLFKVFDAFKPNDGVIRAVSIYPSDFGKERLAKEEREGPPTDIFPKANNTAADEEEDAMSDATDLSDGPLLQNQNGEEFDNDALRKYQLERLRYYYAVVECDSVATARSIYEQCDGNEFERSSLMFDLRYIPDDMDFEDAPKERVTELPMVFKPKEFITSALQNSKVALTWDEDDNERFKMTRRAFNKDDLKKMDFQSYLASSNDEDSSDEEDPEAVRQKYKALLAAKSDDEEDGEDADGDMEVTFAPGLSEMASQLLDKRKEKTQRNHETVFETSLRERREKRKSKKAGAKKGDMEDEDAAAASGDDDYDGLDASEAADPFFQDAFDEAEFGPAPVPKKESVEKSEKKQKGKKGKRSAETNEDASANAELDLLFMEDEPDRLANSKQHFDMDDIVKSEQKKMDKKKKSSKKTTTGVADDEVADDFEIDVKDERFKALLDAPQFAIDPTSSKFKKTPAMVKLMEERKRRQKGDAVATETSGTNSRIADVDAKNGAAADSGSNLSALVDKLKRRQQELTARSKPMKKLKFSAVGK